MNKAEILIIDDEPQIRKLLEITLANQWIYYPGLQYLQKKD